MRLAVACGAVVACALAVATTADARVILRPRVVSQCEQNKSWDAAVACMRKLGRPELLKQLGNARLYDVNQAPDRSSETYLFIEHAGTVYLRGLVRELDEETRFLGFSRQRLGVHTGYRIDVAEQRDVTTPTDGPSLFRRRVSIYCAGRSWRCSEVVTACELLVRGRTRYTFRGKLVVGKEDIRLVGDRTNAGTDCTTDEDVFLVDWPLTRDDDDE